MSWTLINNVMTFPLQPPYPRVILGDTKAGRARRRYTYGRIKESCNVRVLHLNALADARLQAIDEIIIMAQDFECCPHCGNTAIESHWCPACKERIIEPANAYWFAEFLKKKRGPQ